MLFCIRQFSQTINFSKIFLSKNRPIFASFFMIFHDFFGIDFRIDFFIDVWCKMAPKIVHFYLLRWPLWLLFRDLFRRSIFRCILVALWLTLGSILAPFGSLLAPFWLPLAPFGSLLAPFGSLWLTFLLPLAHFLLLLAHFYSIFSLWASPGVVFGPFPIFSTKI